MSLTKISGDVIQGTINVGVVTSTSVTVGTGVTIQSGGATFTGVVTATSFSGNATSATLATNAQGLTGTPNITVGSITAASATFSGNISVAGTVTYEDVTNVDSVGVITARSGLVVGAGASVVGVVTATGGFSGNVTGNVNSSGISTFNNVVVGVVTATSGFSGNLTGNVNSSGISTFNNVVVGGSTTSVVVTGNVRATGIITASQYVFSTQGFNFELKDGILTPSNKTKYTYAYTGSNQTFTVPAGVNYIFVKLWGAGGGAGIPGGWTYGADAGGGGHTRGLFPVTPGSTIIVVVGRGGVTANGSTQSYGGGGTGQNNSDSRYGGQGGGYCGIFVGSVSQANALAIAAGGGGGGTSRAWTGNIGGAGGGLVGQRGSSPYDGKVNAGGAGGTQSAGGATGTNYPAVGNSAGGPGSALQGGFGFNGGYGGGGGGGYYGGGGGSYSEPNTMAGGGGGSGYTNPNGLLTGTYTGNYRNVAYSWDPDLLTTTSDIELPGFGGTNNQGNPGTSSQSGGHAYAVIYY